MKRSPRYATVTIFVALALLFAVTAFLASIHGRVLRSRTNEHLLRGNALADRGQLDEAVDEYHTVLALQRDHRHALRALALTLLALNRFAEAESYLRDLQREQPTDGAVNRALARIYAARGREADARAAYQRAIYGEWPADALDERIATRFELIALLQRLDKREEAVAELLRLKAELPPGQVAAARRVADLLSAAGEPGPAIELLTASVLTAPQDVDLLTQLADIEAEAGRTTDARATLKRAVALAPTREALAERLAVIDRVLTLDPTLPRLRLAARMRRARLVLNAVLEQTRACHRASPDKTGPDWIEATSRVRRRPPTTADMAEEEMALAVRLWKAAPSCHTSSSEARAIAQVLERIEAAAAEPAP